MINREDMLALTKYPGFAKMKANKNLLEVCHGE